MELKLYVVYSENDSVYIVKAKNKKEAIELVYTQYGNITGEKKNGYIARDLEKELFKNCGNVVDLL